MVFKMVPVVAHRIDISEVEDIERERLRVTFENETSLVFMVKTQDVIGHSPRLVLDSEAGGASKNLHKTIARRFYKERVLTNQRFLWRPPPYNTWTIDTAFERVQSTIEMGNEMAPSALQIGKSLVLQYGTLTSETLDYFLHREGRVVEVESFTLPPISATSRTARMATA